MGFSASWAAFNSVPKQQVLSLAGLRDTGMVLDVPEELFQIAELPTGWTVLYSNDVSYASLERLVNLSINHTVLGCQFQEFDMVSVAAFFVRGQVLWQVSHESSKGIFDINVWGRTPPEFAVIQTRLTNRQIESGGVAADVDYIFDIPVELAATVCGYRHDRTRFPWGETMFSVAVPI